MLIVCSLLGPCAHSLSPNVVFRFREFPIFTWRFEVLGQFYYIRNFRYSGIPSFLMP